MIRFTKRARKYWFAIGGIALFIAMNRFQIEIPGLPDLVRDLLIGLAVSEGVFQARNG